MRDVFVDRLKGYACFLVVFGHVIMGIRLCGIKVPGALFTLEKFIWSFHVALFLFLSGYVYRITNEWKSKGTRLRFVGHKLLNLGIPYVFFSAVYVLINSFVSNSNTHYSVSDILLIWKTPIAQYWFLYALFFLFCIWALLSVKLSNLQITVLAAAVGYVFDFGSLSVVSSSALAFGLGTVFSVEFLKNTNRKIKYAILLCHLILGFVLSYFDFINLPFVKETVMVLGICASMVFISLLQKNNSAAKFLGFMNKYSFQIYLLHTIFTAAIRILLIRTGVTSWVVHIALGCIGGIGFSAAAAYIADKMPLLNFLFFPSKEFKRLKN